MPTMWDWIGQCKAQYTPPPDRALTDAQTLANAQIPPWNAPPVIYKPTPPATGWLVKPYIFPLQAPNSGPQAPPMGPHGPPVSVQPPEPPPVSDLTMGTTSLPPGNVGAVYFGVVQASRGTPRYYWAVSGTPWVQISAGGTSQIFQQGILSGTPVAEGTVNLTVTLTDSAVPPASVSKTFPVVIGPPFPLSNMSGDTATAYWDQWFYIQLQVYGGVPPYTWTTGYVPGWTDQYDSIVMQGNPTWDGALSGTPPSGQGGESITVTVNDSAGGSLTFDFFIDVQSM